MTNAVQDPPVGETGTGNGAVDDQDGLFDQVVENPDLEAALEEREKVRQDRAVVNSRWKDADTKAKNEIDELEIGEEAVVRCGRFRIKKSVTKGKSVAFETSDSSRTTISLLDS